jgi:hypothetical protein
MISDDTLVNAFGNQAQTLAAEVKSQAAFQ